MNDFNKCPDCGEQKRVLTLQIIPTGREDFRYPKYIPQVKESCAKCGRYIRFAPQSDYMFEQFNEILKEVKVE